MEYHGALISDQRLKLRREDIELAGAGKRNRIVGQRPYGHIFYSFFKTCRPGCILHITSFGVASKTIAQPPVVSRCGPDRNAPPLGGNGGRQPAIIYFVVNPSTGDR